VCIQLNNKTGDKTMSINITPLDQQVHLKQLEHGFGASNYDHSSQPLTGWRAERQHAENNVSSSKEQSEPVAQKNEPANGKNWIARIANMFNTPRLAN
jgi:hypothetical protein